MVPISKGLEGKVLALFSVQYVVYLGLITWKWIGTPATFAEAVWFLVPAIIFATTNAIWIVEGGAMLAERYKERRFQEGKQEGKQEGRKEGILETQRLWAEWNRRRLEAERSGVSFDEPPPEAPVD